MLYVSTAEDGRPRVIVVPVRILPASTTATGSNKTVLLLYKLLFKVLPVTTFHVCNSAISFHFMCVDYVVHIAFSCTELYLFLCFISVVFYIVFYIVYHCN